MAGKKRRKWISYTVDGILVALIAFLGYVQISMLVTRNSNYGVPKVFGSSFLYVSTDSMNNPDDENCLAPGTGIIIQDVKSIESLKVSTPILDNGVPTGDYERDGAIVTFFYHPYYPDRGIVDTHRLVNKSLDENGVWHLETMGDNPTAHMRKVTEQWTGDDLIGEVVYSSKALGDFLTIASPDAAASAGKTAWLLPVGIIVPLFILALMSIIDVYRKAKEQEKAEEDELLVAMIEAGIDPEDDEAAELFRQKYSIKREYRLKMEEEIERAKKLTLKEKKKKGATK